MNSEIENSTNEKVRKFFLCNIGRIGQNFPNEVSVQTSMLTEFAGYQLNHLNWELHGFKKV